MDSKLVEYTEGKSILLVPEESLIYNVPPMQPAFFNPRGVESRDLSIIVYETFYNQVGKSLQFLDILCGIGARGIRVAKETDISKIYLNDINPNAIEIAKKNAEINNVVEKCIFSNDYAEHFLASSRKEGNYFDIIDVDPFGTPTPFIEDVIRTVKRNGMISLTATDTPVLCGIHEKTALRKYYGRSLRTEYCHEIGLRLLYSSLALAATRYDKGIKPIFCHSTRHYLRVYAIVTDGAEEGDKCLEEIGYIGHCSICHDRIKLLENSGVCKNCGQKLQVAGPLWIGKIFEKKFVKAMEDTAKKLDYKKYLKMINLAYMEADGPISYHLVSGICDRLQIMTPAIEKVVEKLREKGYFATRTILNSRGIRTNAPVKVIEEILLKLAKI
ncbi:MAG: tRNA (guanine(10)-N(2))-dimethyltransferase [Nitrososphaeria archaeon]|nr:tRNA (guanine(10)-N(2))-dimethyltransferase [Nitrososphaeria archaeon]